MEKKDPSASLLAFKRQADPISSKGGSWLDERPCWLKKFFLMATLFEACLDTLAAAEIGF